MFLKVIREMLLILIRQLKKRKTLMGWLFLKHSLSRPKIKKLCKNNLMPLEYDYDTYMPTFFQSITINPYPPIPHYALIVHCAL